MRDCSEISYSAVELCGDVIVNHIKLVFFIPRRFNTYLYTKHEVILIVSFNYVCLTNKNMVFLYRLQCFNYDSVSITSFACVEDGSNII